MLTSTQKLIKSTLKKEIARSVSNDDFYIYVNQTAILRCLTVLQSEPILKFASLVDCFAVDFLEQHGYISIYYHLMSYTLHDRLFVVTNIPADAPAQSITIVFENANWYEREIFDMFGVSFKDHPDLERILTPNGYTSFPLRNV
ncbi:MAG: NADH-quinone oxidoreductase subunit C [Holosporales bacterium]|nr:NADH-quinone oxidoreductase subunit C [Holosporales bacterium]